MTNDNLPRIAFTIGDANGIGPEVLAMALANTDVRRLCRPLIIGNIRLLTEYLDTPSIRAEGATVDNALLKYDKATYPILDIPSDATLNFGSGNADTGKLAGDAIARAIQLCMNHQVEAMVTMPISKQALNQGGYAFPGHTEMLAEQTASTHPLMILLAPTLRVALVTIHSPLKDVAQSLTMDRVVRSIRQLHESLQHDFQILKPRIAVLGLNPHAGESGEIGHEEIDIINPAIERAQAEGINAVGAYPADAFFARYDSHRFDAVLAMYHDQGLIPVKILAHGDGVNFTAGLPIVRTSPDHGTAFDIAGKGVADASSTVAAIRLAVEVHNARETRRQLLEAAESAVRQGN